MVNPIPKEHNVRTFCRITHPYPFNYFAFRMILGKMKNVTRSIVQIKLKKKKSQKSREIPFTGKSDEMKCRPIVVMVASLRNNDDNNNRERHLQLTQK